MGSPVSIPFKSFIQVDRTSSNAIYMQIVNQLIHAIQRGALPPGTKLPGTRALSELLDTHRNTAVAVYEELSAQGWIEIRPNQGTFIASQLPNLEKGAKTTKKYANTTGFSFEKSNLLDNPYEYTKCDHIFTDGTPDIRLTQVSDLSGFYSSNMKRKSNLRKMNWYNHDGSEYFKQQLARYLHLSRGLNISTDNLLITRSAEMSLFIISEILLRKDDAVVVGMPGNFSANMVFQKTGARIYTIPVDQEGLDTHALLELCKKMRIRMVYVTPHHHYPTTVSLSAPRRMQLLQLAREYGFIIVEDDYDYDFQYDKKPLLPLASVDDQGMVIYVGSFGKSLAPGFRTGFVVSPANLMKEMRKYLGIIDRQGDIVMEQVLGEMIEEGAIHRHLNKSLKVYKARRDTMADGLTRAFGNKLTFTVPSGGLALWATWKYPVNLLKLSQEASKQGLFIPKTLLYQDKKLTAMRIGFGHLDETEIGKSLEILKSTFSSMQAK